MLKKSISMLTILLICGNISVSSALWRSSNGYFPLRRVMNIEQHTDMGGGSWELSSHVSASLSLYSIGFHVPSPPRTLSASYQPSDGPGGYVALAGEKTHDQESVDKAIGKILNIPKNIQLVADKTEVLPGETVKFTANAAGTLKDVVFVWSDIYPYIFNKNDVKVSADGLEIEIRIPDRFSGVFWVVVSTGVVDGRYAQSEKVSVVVKPDLSKLSLMTFSVGSQLTRVAGTQFSLETRGSVHRRQRLRSHPPRVGHDLRQQRSVRGHRLAGWSGKGHRSGRNHHNGQKR